MTKVAMIQMSGAYDKAKNVEKACTFIRQATQQGARIICLQELFNTVYFCLKELPEYYSWAETIPGPTTDQIAEVARQEHVVVIAPSYERDRAVKGLAGLGIN